jgi:hypothetical protein
MSVPITAASTTTTSSPMPPYFSSSMLSGMYSALKIAMTTSVSAVAIAAAIVASQ